MKYTLDFPSRKGKCDLLNKNRIMKETQRVDMGRHARLLFLNGWVPCSLFSSLSSRIFKKNDDLHKNPVFSHTIFFSSPESHSINFLPYHFLSVEFTKEKIVGSLHKMPLSLYIFLSTFIMWCKGRSKKK